MVKEKKKEKGFKIHSIFLILAFITFSIYLIIEVLHYDSLLNFLPKLLGIILILLFLVCFIVIGLKNRNQHGTIIVGSILITIYSLFNILLVLNIISLPSDEYIPNFYQKSVTEVNEWKESNKINVIENYEYSDLVKKDLIISQSLMAPTLTKDTKELTVTISLGPDPLKEIIVPNFIGLKYDDVIKYIEENHLSNATIDYQNSEKEIDTVISQSKSGTMKRNEEIIITFAKEEIEGEIEIIDFTNKSLLFAKSWLLKYEFNVEVLEEFSDTVEDGNIIKQSAVNEVKDPKEDVITLTVSKGRQNIAPDISLMTSNEINKWALENDIKISYKEEYSDEVKLGDIISSSVKKDDIINPDEKVEIIISKGALEMIKVTNVNEFINWAETNNIDYQINYESSDTIKKDEIIKTSHNVGSKIKKDDTVIITVSKGKMISIPNFVGMSKNDIQSKCNNINLNCSFKTGGYTEKTKAGIAISQSKKSGTSVSEGTSLTITLSAGIQEKVSVPSFKGKTKTTITSECNKIGIKCTFSYASGYSSTPKDICTGQSKTGTVNKGSTITITLSNGPAKTFSIIIDANQLSSGNPTATKNTLEKKLKANCPGVNFNFIMQKANSGIGYLASNSKVKVGLNKLVQGETYNVIINSN